MAAKPTPHLIAAALIALVAVALAAGPLGTGPTRAVIEATDPRVPQSSAAVYSAGRVAEPLVPAFAEAPIDNVLILRTTSTVRGPRIGLPPPPPVASPRPPVLPLVEVTR